MVAPASHGIPRVPWYSGPASASPYRTLTFSRPSQTLQVPTSPNAVLQHRLLSTWFGLLRVRSPLLTESSLFLALLRCFSSRGSPACASYRFTIWGFPIRIPPSIAAVYASRSLFAVYRVLHRHEMPRHPLCPLIRFVRVIRRSGWF